MRLALRRATACLSIVPGILSLILPASGAPRLVRDVNPLAEDLARQPGKVTMAGGKAFFSAWSSGHGAELWVSDGTRAGTRMLKDIFPAAGSSWPSRMQEMGGKLYFVADDGTHGMELWCSDGTEAGTVLFADLTEGSASSALNVIGGNATRLWFTIGADDAAELWSTDGTLAGAIELNPPQPVMRAFIRPEHFAMREGVLYFVAGRSELWRSNWWPGRTACITSSRM
jgi:ELWxxDGT repeat protein